MLFQTKRGIVHFMGNILSGNERTRRAAEAELQAAVKLDPKNANYRVMLAELYRDLGLKLRAKGEAERAVAADPNNQKARELVTSAEIATKAQTIS